MTTELKPEGCQTLVYDREVHPHQCQKKPVVWRDGKNYCRIHDLKYIRGKQVAAKEQQDKEMVANHARWDRSNARNAATEGLTLEELRRVTPDMVRAANEMYETLLAFDKYFMTNYPADIRLRISAEKMDEVLAKVKGAK